VVFDYNEHVSKFCRKCQVEGKEIKVEEFPKEILDDNEFVNSLRLNIQKMQQQI